MNCGEQVLSRISKYLQINKKFTKIKNFSVQSRPILFTLVVTDNEMR